VKKNQTMETRPVRSRIRYRGFEGESDYPKMLAVINAAKLADGDDRFDTVEDIAATYRHLDNCDPYSDMRLAEVDGNVVAYSRVWWGEELSGTRVYSHFCFIDPAWRNQGVGGSLLDWNMGRLVEIGADHPVGNKLLDTFSIQTDPIAAHLLEGRGYRAVTYGAEMVRPDLDDIPEVELPEGLEMRPVTEDHLRPIWEADQEAFRDHWGYQASTENRWQEFLDFPHTDTTLWKVAWSDEGVAGQVRSFINLGENAEYGRKRGYTESISTARSHRRRGVARALLAASLEELRRRGMEQAALGVHTENPNGAFTLYESMGFVVTKLFATYRRPL